MEKTISTETKMLTKISSSLPHIAETVKGNWVDYAKIQQHTVQSFGKSMLTSICLASLVGSSQLAAGLSALNVLGLIAGEAVLGFTYAANKATATALTALGL